MLGKGWYTRIRILSNASSYRAAFLVSRGGDGAITVFIHQCTCRWAFKMSTHILSLLLPLALIVAQKYFHPWPLEECNLLVLRKLLTVSDMYQHMWRENSFFDQDCETSQTALLLSILPAMPPGNKNRIYIAYYVRLVHTDNPDPFHDSILIAPKNKISGTQRFHATNSKTVFVDNVPTTPWQFESVPSERRTAKLKAVLLLGKLAPSVSISMVEDALREVPIIQDDPRWKCHSWTIGAIDVRTDRIWESENFQVFL